MKPRFDYSDTRKLVGVCQKDVHRPNDTATIWKKFMPRRGEINNRLNSNYISMRVFQRLADDPLTHQTAYDEWAAVEVSEAADIPAGMEFFLVPDGAYAVFIHEGPASGFPDTMKSIFNEWLPSSEYELDNRPHLAIMGADYRPDDPDATEEIWIPIAKR